MLKKLGIFLVGSNVGALSLYAIQRKKKDVKTEKVAVIRMSGVIGARWNTKSGISAESYIPVLNAAFELPNVKAVALVINSPGGSPVQSSLINKRIIALRKRNPEIPLLAFVEDYAASGGYYIACAAEEIIADESSIVGSIGVISASFGFNKAIEKLGIDRRVYTAGVKKCLIDPFQEENARGLLMHKKKMGILHNTFINAVKKGRGNKLKLDVAAEKARAIDRELMVDEIKQPLTIVKSVNEMEGQGLFDGSTYVGKPAIEVGLIDSFGDHFSVLPKRFGKNIKLVELKPKKSWLEKLSTVGGGALGTFATQEFVSGVIGELNQREQQYLYR